MFVTLVPTALDDLTCVRLVLLHRGVGEEAHIIMHIEVEKRARFASRFVDYEVVECVMLEEIHP